MARADSTIRVNIIGDAKDLQKAAGKAEGAVSGMNKKFVAAGAAVAGLFAADKIIEFGNTALDEFDRLGDATDRLNEQLGSLAKPLIANAEHFSDIGASAQDMLELEARIADIGTSAGVADDEIAGMAEQAAATAQALTLLGGLEGDQAIDLIGKASLGGVKALRELGISLTDAEVEARALANTGKDSADTLTDGEKAAAGMQLVLEKLQPRVADINAGYTDLEQRQAAVQAKFETLTAKVGEALQGPLTEFLAWLLSTAEWLDTVGFNASDLAEDIAEIEGAVRTLLSPLASANDLLQEFLRLTGLASQEQGFSGQISGGPGRTQRGGGDANRSGPSTVNVNVQGGSPEAIEQAVRNAVNTVTRRSGALE